MKMPNNELSVIDDNKIRDYLLNLNHEIGKHKAKFFRAFNFSNDDIEEFKGALLRHSRDREIQKETDNKYGTKYELRCDIITPDSRNPCIVTVWIIEKGRIAPKLITAYPND